MRSGGRRKKESLNDRRDGLWCVSGLFGEVSSQYFLIYLHHSLTPLVPITIVGQGGVVRIEIGIRPMYTPPTRQPTGQTLAPLPSPETAEVPGVAASADTRHTAPFGMPTAALSLFVVTRQVLAVGQRRARVFHQLFVFLLSFFCRPLHIYIVLCSVSIECSCMPCILCYLGFSLYIVTNERTAC
jgi:hypothetical protein